MEPSHNYTIFRRCPADTAARTVESSRVLAVSRSLMLESLLRLDSRRRLADRMDRTQHSDSVALTMLRSYPSLLAFSAANCQSCRTDTLHNRAASLDGIGRSRSRFDRGPAWRLGMLMPPVELILGRHIAIHL